MKVRAMVFMLCIYGCTSYHPLSSQEQIVQKCSEAGYKDKEFEACVFSATAAYKKEQERQDKENANNIAKRDREIIAARKQAAKIQQENDSEKCKGYGLKYGTKDFASCMMSIEAARNNAAAAQESQQQAPKKRELPDGLQANLNQLAYLRSLDTGLPTNGDMLVRISAGQKEAEIKTQLLQSGWDTGSINQLLQTFQPPPPPRRAPPKTIDCDKFGNGFSCTEW